MTPYQKEQIQRLRQEGMSYKGIAALLCISENTVKSFCWRNAISSASFEEPSTLDDHYTFCRNCGKPIENRLKIKPRKFCSDECRLSWWNKHADQVTRKAVYRLVCDGCGNAFESYGNKNRKYCSHACYIKARFRSEVKD